MVNRRVLPIFYSFSFCVIPGRSPFKIMAPSHRSSQGSAPSDYLPRISIPAFHSPQADVPPGAHQEGRNLDSPIGRQTRSSIRSSRPCWPKPLPRVFPSQVTPLGFGCHRQFLYQAQPFTHPSKVHKEAETAGVETWTSQLVDRHLLQQQESQPSRTQALQADVSGAHHDALDTTIPMPSMAHSLLVPDRHLATAAFYFCFAGR